MRISPCSTLFHVCAYLHPLDIDAAAANPEIAYTLEWCDFEAAVPALINTFGSTGHDSGSGSSAGGSGSGGPLPQVAYAQPEYEFDE